MLNNEKILKNCQLIENNTKNIIISNFKLNKFIIKKFFNNYLIKQKYIIFIIMYIYIYIL
jgi:hypothetical protein